MALVQVCGVCGTRSPHGTAACPRCTARVFGYEGTQDPALSASGPAEPESTAALTDLSGLPDAYGLLSTGAWLEHPGYGEPLTGIEHPADGTWSPELSAPFDPPADAVSRETVPPDDAPVPDTPSADGAPGIPARAPRKPRARKVPNGDTTVSDG